MKYFWFWVILILAFGYLTCEISARTINHKETNEPSYIRSDKRARIIPGALVVKKIVLLKFKKILPLSVGLLKSVNANEAEFLPIYASSEIPSDVKFIHTPNGISGHKDVEAIAVPLKLYENLKLDDDTDLEIVESLVNVAETYDDDESSLKLEESSSKKDKLLMAKDENENQLLNISTDNKAIRKSNEEMPMENVKSSLNSLTSIEGVPIYMYSTRAGHVVKHRIGVLD